MPTLARDDRVECPACGIPGFEARHFDLHAALPRELGQPCVGVDPEHLATGRLKLPRHDASGSADVEDARARGPGDDALDQSRGIARPGPVIACGIRPERIRRLTRRSIAFWLVSGLLALTMPFVDDPLDIEGCQRGRRVGDPFSVGLADPPVDGLDDLPHIGL